MVLRPVLVAGRFSLFVLFQLKVYAALLCSSFSFFGWFSDWCTAHKQHYRRKKIFARIDDFDRIYFKGILPAPLTSFCVTTTAMVSWILAYLLD